jgi:2-dehydro-3-deoxygluconokinase
MMKVALIGECMIEFAQLGEGVFQQAFGGDTLNTAIYMARLAHGSTHKIAYFTALGQDEWSKQMLNAWAQEGIDTTHVLQFEGRTPGLYVIETDAKGERCFSYWRDTSPARELFTTAQSENLVTALNAYDFIYCSGITLSLYTPEGLQKLFHAIDALRQKGGRFAFDTNFRPRGWKELAFAQATYQEALQRADILLASQEDLSLLYGAEQAKPVFLAQTQIAERLFKQNDCTVWLLAQGKEASIAPAQLITPLDTTAAGDSFAAAYCYARLCGESAEKAVQAGHDLAFHVIQYRGAILPREQMQGEH